MSVRLIIAAGLLPLDGGISLCLETQPSSLEAWWKVERQRAHNLHVRTSVGLLESGRTGGCPTVFSDLVDDV